MYSSGSLKDFSRGQKDLEAAIESTIQTVAFMIDSQHYCIDIMQVREIRNWTGVTELPNTPDYMLGVFNLRGVILPIIDLKARFGLGKSVPTSVHAVVIVSLGGKLHGLLVDSVSDIITCREKDVSPIPEALGQAQNPLLSGIITTGDQLMAIVALERLISTSETLGVTK
jgi:purine-binding chemotaxis protein CheW